MNSMGTKYELEPSIPIIKKYRANLYDKFDEMYANKFKHLKNHPFNKFTDGLIDETYINRYCFLRAIDDYKAHYNTTVQLSLQDEDMAFNYRPYNM